MVYIDTIIFDILQPLDNRQYEIYEDKISTLMYLLNRSYIENEEIYKRISSYRFVFGDIFYIFKEYINALKYIDEHKDIYAKRKNKEILFAKVFDYRMNTDMSYVLMENEAQGFIQETVKAMINANEQISLNFFRLITYLLVSKKEKRFIRFVERHSDIDINYLLCEL